jgi:hypothetical protein
MERAMAMAMNGGAIWGASRQRSAANAGCLLALLLLAPAAIAQNEPPAVAAPPAPQRTPAIPPTVSYAGGQLKIGAPDSTLADVLTKVAALTGMKIEVPPGAESERMAVELGPGPARQVLASLLSESSFDYVIQSSDEDRESVRSVLLMPRGPKGNGTERTDQAARPSRSPFVRAMEAPEPSAADSPVPALPGNAPDAAALDSQPPPAQPDPSMPPAPPPAQPQQPGSPRPGALTPPATLDQQSISQQLQQMYQQRAQMVQQERQAGPPAPLANPGNK